MKRTRNPFLIFRNRFPFFPFWGFAGFILSFVACSSPQDSPYAPTHARSNSYYNEGLEASYLRDFELAMLKEINFARTRPQEYARERVLPQFSVACTSDYVDTYVRPAYERLMQMQPLHPFRPALGLTLTVRDFIADPKRGDGVDPHHSTSPGYQGLGDRQHYTVGNAGEIAWPSASNEESSEVNMGCGENYVLGWIIDRGNAPGYGHREAILNPDYYYIGIAYGHQTNAQGLAGVYANLGRKDYRDRTDGSFNNGRLSRRSVYTGVTWPVERY